MHNKSVVTAFLFIVFAFTGGSAQTNKEDLIRIKIDAGQFKSSGNVSDYLEVVKLIPLETTKDCLIGEIDKVVQYRNNIYVFDLRQQRLLWFGSDGKFHGQIGQRGKGPGEYLEMQDFQVDTINELIYLSDFRKIHTFSINGKWIKSANTEFMAYAVHQSTNNEFVFYGGGRDNRIYWTNSDFKVINSFFPYSLAYRMSPRYPLFNFYGKTAFQIPTCDTIFTLTDGKPKPLFYLDFNGKNFTHQDFGRLSLSEQSNLYDYLMNSGKYMMCQAFLPLKNSAFINMVNSKTAYWGIYNLDTHQCSFVPLKKLTNDIFGPFVVLLPAGITKDEFIFTVPPDKLIKDKTSSFYKKYNKVLDGLTELSNPVLLLAKPKI